MACSASIPTEGQETGWDAHALTYRSVRTAQIIKQPPMGRETDSFNKRLNSSSCSWSGGKHKQGLYYTTVFPASCNDQSDAPSSDTLDRWRSHRRLTPKRRQEEKKDNKRGGSEGFIFQSISRWNECPCASHPQMQEKMKKKKRHIC